jgi:hypothetical protein
MTTVFQYLKPVILEGANLDSVRMILLTAFCSKGMEYTKIYTKAVREGTYTSDMFTTIALRLYTELEEIQFQLLNLGFETDLMKNQGIIKITV